MVTSLGNMSSNIIDKAERDGSSFSPIKVLSTSQVGQVSRDRPRRKMEKPRPMVQKDHRVSEKSIASYWSNSIERHKVIFLPFMHSGIYSTFNLILASV